MTERPSLGGRHSKPKGGWEEEEKAAEGTEEELPGRWENPEEGCPGSQREKVCQQEGGKGAPIKSC